MRVVILDVDDTLFDWLGMWSESFSALITSIEHASEKSRQELTTIFRTFHVAAKTSERGLSGGDAQSLGVASSFASRAADEFEENLRKRTVCFPQVLDTLERLQARGLRLIAHTDTPVNIAADRLVKLGLDGVVEALFATSSHGVTIFRQDLAWPTQSRVVDIPYLKPDTRSIGAVLSDIGENAGDCIYVGDSKMKDIPMARAMGMRDVFAGYGCRRASDAYNLLRSVSHWTSADIERERSLLSTEATYSLDSFEQVLSLM